MAVKKGPIKPPLKKSVDKDKSKKIHPKLKVPVRRIKSEKIESKKGEKKMAEEKAEYVGTSGYAKSRQQDEETKRQQASKQEDSAKKDKQERKKSKEYKLGSGEEGEEKNLEEAFQNLLKTRREFIDASEDVRIAGEEGNAVEIDSFRENRARILSKWQSQYAEFTRQMNITMDYK